MIKDAAVDISSDCGLMMTNNMYKFAIMVTDSCISNILSFNRLSELIAMIVLSIPFLR